MRNTIFLLACASVLTANVHAQATPEAPAAQRCPLPQSFKAPHLYGAWRIELTAKGQKGRLVLRQHPEFTESLRGELSYGTTTSIASGDLEEGELNLDESSDRVSMTATWTGKLVPTSCGKEIRGEWHDLQKDTRSPFILRRESGW